MMAPPSVTLAELEATFLDLRQAPPDLSSAFATAFATATGASADPACLGPLHRAGAAVTEVIRAHPGKTLTLPYHNHHHFAEAMLAMGHLCAAARQLGLISEVDAAAGIVAMAGHDIDHDGISIEGGTLEAHSADATERICRAQSVSAGEAARIGYIITGTDPAVVTDNEARSAGTLPPGPFGPKGDMLRSLANEADVLGSLLPHLGLRLGDALAAERRAAGDAGADALASFTGRLTFLRRYAWFTPAAGALDLPGIVSAQLTGYARIARCLGVGETADDGAAALDHMDRDAARARYIAEATLP